MTPNLTKAQIEEILEKLNVEYHSSAKKAELEELLGSLEDKPNYDDVVASVVKAKEGDENVPEEDEEAPNPFIDQQGKRLKLDDDKLRQYQDKGLLVGWNPKTREALVKEEI